MNRRNVFQKGSKIGEYTLISFIGSGGSAEVWQVEDESGNLWAMKIFSPDKGMDGVTIKIFKEEFRRTLEFEHPNILSGIKYGEFNRRPYILFDLCTTSLMSRLKERQYDLTTTRVAPYTEKEIANILRDVVDALVYLHNKDVIHQDIKPDNILVLKNLKNKERYLVSDFGVSTKIKKTILRETQQLVKERSGLSPDYAAPEQFKGAPVKKSDIFSLGVTIYELCEGTTPSRSNITCTAEALMNGGTIPDLTGEYSTRLNDLVKSCMALEPEKRPDANLIKSWVETYLENGFWPADTGKVAKAITIKRKKRILLFSILGIVLLGGGALLFSFFNHNSESDLKLFDAYVKNGNYDMALSIAEQNEQTQFYQEMKTKLEDLKATVDKYNRMNDEYAIYIDKNGNYGIIQNGIDIKLNAKYDDILPFRSDSIITVTKNGKCGYINIEGKELFKGIVYDNCDNFTSLSEAKTKYSKG